MQRFIYIFFHFVRRSRTLFLLTLFCTFVASRKKEEGFVGFREEHEHVGGRHEVSRCCWLLRENIARSDFETISKTTFLSFILFLSRACLDVLDAKEYNGAVKQRI